MASEKVKNPNGWMAIIVAAILPIIVLVLDVKDGKIDDAENYQAVQDIVNDAVNKALIDAGVLVVDEPADSSAVVEGE